MKKIFIEPEIKRIELNLNENIASSKIFETENGIFLITHGLEGCLEKVVGTDVPYTEDINQSTENWDKIRLCFKFTMKQTARMLGLPISNDMY